MRREGLGGGAGGWCRKEITKHNSAMVCAHALGCISRVHLLVYCVRELLLLYWLVCMYYLLCMCMYVMYESVCN